MYIDSLSSAGQIFLLQLATWRSVGRSVGQAGGRAGRQAGRQAGKRASGQASGRAGALATKMMRFRLICVLLHCLNNIRKQEQYSRPTFQITSIG
jgi:hypothetical protein